MRVNVNKYLMIGPWSERESFFQRVQELGVVEFISKKPPSIETPHEIQNFVDALHVLRQMVPVKETPAQDYRSAHVLARHIVERSQELEHLREQSRVLEKEIARIKIFGDFSLSDFHKIEQESGRVIQLFFSKKGAEIEAPKRPEVIYVGSEYGLDYYCSINKQRTVYDGLIEIVIDKTLGELQDQKAGVNRSIDTYETELATLAHYKKLLKQGLINTLNHTHLDASKQRVESLIGGEVFAIETWIPKDKIQLILKLADELNIYVEPIQIEKTDRRPTYLENKGVARLGEDLINIYDIPSPYDRDPSMWVFFAFGLFFSMMVGDLGYGLILLGISLFLFYKFGRQKGLGRRIILLSIYLSLGVIIWGILSTSFFGIQFNPDSKFRIVSPINWMVKQKAAYLLEHKPVSYTDLIQDFPGLKGETTVNGLLTTVKQKQEGMNEYVVYGNFTNNVLMELAIFIGAIHIILSFFRYLDRNWAGIGWVMFIVGAYLFFPSILKAISLIHYVFHVPYEMGAFIGKYILYSGLGLVVILALIQRRLRGVLEIMQVTQVFADVTSYLRIYAILLAGSVMGSAFDGIGMRVPLYIGIFIILAGHAVNFTLSIMGGIIQGLRLNFIEWYHYSFDGGGKKFNPLSLIKIG